MNNSSQSPEQRDFHCHHCKGRIVIPYNLAPTTGPCPHCQSTNTSPPPPVSTPSDISSADIVPSLAPVEETQPSSLSGDTKSSPIGIIPATIILLLLLLAGGAAIYFLSNQNGKHVDPPNQGRSPEDIKFDEENYILIDWQADAYKTLAAFLKGSSVEEKLPHVVNTEALREKMDLFYGGAVIDDNDTPINLFSIEHLSEEDRRRGIFLLKYEQPAQVLLSNLFHPIIPLEVEYGLEEAGLLLSAIRNKSDIEMEPVQAFAFFKRTDKGLKLFWELFAQTKYRTFRNFTELPDIGAVETFYVFIIEDVPDKGQYVPGTRSYSMIDTGYPDYFIRVNVRLDSDTGKELSVINWRGTKEDRPLPRSATVELEWTGNPDKPVLSMKRLVCWEYLGLGGVEIPVSTSGPSSTQ